MSGEDTGTGEVGPRTAKATGPRYDAAEIRGRMAVSFSLPALRKLAEVLGVTGVPWDRGAGEAAREVVRSFERRGQLEALVARLRQERPLVEWPEPLPDPYAPTVSAPLSPSSPAAPGLPTFMLGAPAPPAPAPAPLALAPASPAPAPAPVEASAASDYRHEAPTLTGEESEAAAAAQNEPEETLARANPTEGASVVAAPQAPQAPQAPLAPQTPLEPQAPQAPQAPLAPQAPQARPVPSPAGPTQNEPPLIDPYASQYAAGSAGWPGTEPAPKREGQARGLDARILVAVAGLMVVAVGLAFLAGRSLTADTGAAADATNAASPARRPDGVATRAADALSRHIDSVARACEVEPGAPTEVMRRAFARCGPAPAPTAARPPPRPAATSAAEPPAAPAPAPALDPRPRSVAPPPPAPVTADNAGCLSSCERQHQSCKASQCGSEPTQGSKYKVYQDCLSTCLRAASQCRLACQ